MGSEDDQPIFGFHTDGTPAETRPTRRRRRGASSSTSRERVPPAPYPLRRRSVSVEAEISFEWDGIMERNEARLRSESYINQLGERSTPEPRSPGASNYRIFMASPRVDGVDAGNVQSPRRGAIARGRDGAPDGRDSAPPPDGAAAQPNNVHPQDPAPNGAYGGAR